ncbi:MAG: murein biosynthesis integral membrane protein MurJ [Frankiales bacterium]|nr:murein biosynthesis integral membrane protein MurJ [Frankiales bacterium]
MPDADGGVPAAGAAPRDPGGDARGELAESLGEELAGDVASDGGADATSESVPAGSSSSVLRSSAVMGVGTVASRLGGVLRGVALASALGAGIVSDAFSLGNTLPNVVYILVIGGALNAVFIPELVRHMKDDGDDGQAYADRLITLVGTALLVVSVVAVVIAPWIVGIYASSSASASDVDLATAFARFCLPQIFFYGVYTMFSQVLNARGRFGAPMFAPLANNVVAIATFLLFIVVAGPARLGATTIPPGQVALLGIGTTLGVAVQALVLVPVLVRARYVWRPRFDWRGAGLSTAGGLAFWTIALVLVNQLAYVVIVRLATTANIVAQQNGTTAGGLTSYTNAHLIFVLPHSVITVSVVAALLPRMSRAAHAHDYTGLAADIAGGMRSVSALIVPSAVGLVVLGTQAGLLLLGYGATSAAEAELTGSVASVLALGLLPFTLYYIVLRGWYALELTLTAFWVTVVLNVLYLAFAYPLFRWATSVSDASFGLLALALGYSLSYWLTLVLAWRVLSRRLGGLQTRRTVGALARMALAGAAMLVVMVAVQRLVGGALTGTGRLHALADIAVVGSLGLMTYLGAATLLRIGEVTEALALLRRRLGRGR